MINANKKILVIAPHADDEVLGCGGYLLHEKAKNSDIFIVVGTIGGLDKRQDSSTRHSEFGEVCDAIGVKENFILYEGRDALMDTIPAYEIISKLDRIIDRIRPDELFVNYSSLHQDHIKMHDCTMAACRLREGYSPKIIALYEYPFCTTQIDTIGGGFMYHDISDCIDEKVNLFELYSSQIRTSPSPLNRDGILALARIRGVECGVLYAEKFYVQRMVI